MSVQASEQSLIKALLISQRSYSLVSERLLCKQKRLCRSPSHIAVWLASLTQRERSIVRLVAQGLSNSEIADQACISTITVRHHLTRIFDKLGVESRQN
jgi:DNA-binding NarL/FixJ family response regulator